MNTLLDVVKKERTLADIVYTEGTTRVHRRLLEMIEQQGVTNVSPEWVMTYLVNRQTK
jgi:hypothetical protein